MTTNISPLHSKFSSSDLASLKSSNNAYRKSTNLLNPSGATKSGTFLNYGTPQESNSYNPSYSTSPRQASLSGNSKKSPLKSLVIDTNEEISKYGNPQTHHFGSYTTTHGTSSSYNFSKNSLLSSLNGNLTTKFSRTNDPYKPSLLPATKSLSSGKLMLGSTNLGYPTTNQASKENTSPLMNTAPDSLSSGITPSHTHFKSGSSKFYPLEPSKLNTHEGIASDMKGSISSQNKPVYQSYQQENQPLNESKSASTALSQTESSASLSSSHNENITQASKSSAQTPTTKKTPIPNHEPTKCSVKRNGIVKAYAANTNQGIVRNYNEDRVSIILNIMKPASRVNEDWPKCSFFGVYDGHGGVTCADFLRDNLHQYVIKEPSFPWNPKEALMKGFDAAEKAFLEIAQGPNGEIDRSGSCAIVVLIIGDMCYVANVGDSRAVMSGDGGTKIFPLSRDHKPNDELEQKRIIEGGGKIYQTQAPALRQVTEGNTTKPQVQLLLGPHRVFPGRLSVSRTFGDIEAKLPRLGGNPNVVIPVPEIKAFKIAADHDFIVLASDGIYDKLSSRDVIKSVWESTHEQANNIHNQCGLGVENILREAIHRRTLDNITVVMICFKNFKYKLFPREKSKKTGEETLHRKETEPSLARNILKPSNSTTHFSGRAVSQNHKERLNDQENHYEPASFSTFQKIHLGRKTPAPLSDGNIDQNVMDMKRYNLEKGENNFSDSSLLNKRTTPKRTGSSIANNENQKPESFHRYIHNTNMANFKSMDYKNGDLSKFRSFEK